MPTDPEADSDVACLTASASGRDRGLGYLENSHTNRTLALAGVFQAARLVQQLAHQGRSDTAALVASINSVLELDAATTEAVYGGARGVALGLELLRDKLRGHTETSDAELARYVVNVLQLERKLARDRVLLIRIRRGLESVRALVTDGDPKVSADVTAKLAKLYRTTLSTVEPRIMVSGSQSHLANPLTTDKVRAVLLAGVRSAFLWRQLGGKRWHLVLAKNSIVRDAMHLLEQLRAPVPLA
jgi:high frequency lysogenization protein